MRGLKIEENLKKDVYKQVNKKEKKEELWSIMKDNREECGMMKAL